MPGGQIINGLLTDKIGGKRAMLIGAAGTIVMNILFGAASFLGIFGLFVAIWGLNGYVQAFGAPGMVKINAAWFARRERGTFAGIFGFMINLGGSSSTSSGRHCSLDLRLSGSERRSAPLAMAVLGSVDSLLHRSNLHVYRRR